MMKGICTLGNDYVYDQIVALVNSIEMHAGTDLPICIYPYDDQVEGLKEFASDRPQVSIFADQDVIARWDRWVEKIWACHPTAAQKWFAVNGKPGIHRMGTHRRLCAFEGPFDRFIYMDADTLLLNTPESIFQALDDVDWVNYDFQYKDLSHVFDITNEKFSLTFNQESLHQKTFCSGFYGTKRQVVTATDIDFYLDKLSEGEAEILYPMAPDQTILNYFVLRKPIRSMNFAQALPATEKTGNSITSSHFQEQAHVLYDKGIRLLYLHYIGISASVFKRLCQGENIDFPYRELFLHYRYLHQADARPAFAGEPFSYQPAPLTLPQKIAKKLGFMPTAKK